MESGNEPDALIAAITRRKRALFHNKRGEKNKYSSILDDRCDKT